MTKMNVSKQNREATMNSIDEFHFRYYCNRLLREGYIDQQEYQALLTANRLETDTNVKSILSR